MATAFPPQEVGNCRVHLPSDESSPVFGASSAAVRGWLAAGCPAEALPPFLKVRGPPHTPQAATTA